LKKRNIIADLHNHSTASDGEYSPFELVKKASELGLKAVGLTDHDTLSGLEEALQAGAEFGIKVVPGVEVSLAFKHPIFVGTLHLLLYFSENLLKNDTFKKLAKEIFIQGRGPSLIQARVKEINKVFGAQGDQRMLKYALNFEEVAAYSNNVTRRHFALALKEKHGIKDRDQISKIIGNGSPAYIPSGIDMKLLKPLIDSFPVVPVFAHPAAGSFPGESHYKEVLPPVQTVETLLPEFLDPDILGIKGIEVYYPGHTEQHRKLLLQWAEKYNLIVTGGSDCHDSVQRPLGIEGVTQEELEVLLMSIGSKS